MTIRPAGLAPVAPTENVLLTVVRTDLAQVVARIKKVWHHNSHSGYSCRVEAAGVDQTCRGESGTGSEAAPAVATHYSPSADRSPPVVAAAEDHLGS